jgi:hypothetical protein
MIDALRILRQHFSSSAKFLLIGALCGLLDNF